MTPSFNKTTIILLTGLLALSLFCYCAPRVEKPMPRIILLYPQDSSADEPTPCGWVEIFTQKTAREIIYSGTAHQLALYPEGGAQLSGSFWLHLDKETGQLLYYREKQEPPGRTVTLVPGEQGVWRLSIEYGLEKKTCSLPEGNIYPLDCAYLLPEILWEESGSVLLFDPLNLACFPAYVETSVGEEGGYAWRLTSGTIRLWDLYINSDGELIEGQDRLQRFRMEPAEELPVKLSAQMLSFSPTSWIDSGATAPLQIEVQADIIGSAFDPDILTGQEQSFKGEISPESISGFFTLSPSSTELSPESSPTSSSVLTTDENSPLPTIPPLSVCLPSPEELEQILVDLSPPEVNAQEQADWLVNWMAENVQTIPLQDSPQQLFADSEGSEKAKAFAGSLLAEQMGLSARPVLGLVYDQMYGGFRAGWWLEIELEGAGWSAYDLSTGDQAGNDRIRLLAGLGAFNARIVSFSCQLANPVEKTTIFMPKDNTYNYYSQGEKIGSAHLWKEGGAKGLLFRVESPALVYEGSLILPRETIVGELKIKAPVDAEEAKFYPPVGDFSIPLYPPGGDNPAQVPLDIYNTATILCLLDYAGDSESSGTIELQSIWSQLQIPAHLVHLGRKELEIGREQISAEEYLLLPLKISIWVSDRGELLGLAWEGVEMRAEKVELIASGETGGDIRVEEEPVDE